MGSLLYPAACFVVLFQVITFAYASMRPELRVVTMLQDSAEEGSVEEPDDGGATGSALSTNRSKYIRTNTKSHRTLDGQGGSAGGSGIATGSSAGDGGGGDSEGSGESSPGGDSNRRSLVGRRSSMHGEEGGGGAGGRKNGREGWCPGSTFVASNWRNWLVVSTLLIETLQVIPRGWGWDHVWSRVCVCVCAYRLPLMMKRPYIQNLTHSSPPSPLSPHFPFAQFNAMLFQPGVSSNS
jgi:hypothetical protein